MRTAHFRGDAWQKCDFAALYYSFWVQRHAAARLTRITLSAAAGAARKAVALPKDTLGKSVILPRLILSKKQKGKGQVRHKPRLPFRFSLA